MSHSVLERRKPRKVKSREAERQRIARRKAANSTRPCAVIGCTDLRHDLAPYCKYHRKRSRKNAHPTLEPPTKPVIVALEQVITEWLETDYLVSSPSLTRNDFIKMWSSALGRLSPSKAYAIPFWNLEGGSDFTTRTKGRIVLAHYQHTQGKPLGATMLRHMAWSLWAEFCFTLPHGKTDLAKQKQLFVDQHAGLVVVKNSGFSRTRIVDTIVGWEKPSVISAIESENQWTPITKRSKHVKQLNRFAKRTIAKAIGHDLDEAVEYAMGKRWMNNQHLQDMASRAIEKATSSGKYAVKFSAFPKAKREVQIARAMATTLERQNNAVPYIPKRQTHHTNKGNMINL